MMILAACFVAVAKGLNRYMVECKSRLREELEEGAKIIHKSIDAWKEEIRAAVESKKGEKKDGKDGIDP